jgi:small subunit ribosomal protein S20
MANKRSSKKDLRRSAKRRVQNQGVRTALKTYVKKVKNASDEKAAAEALKAAVSALDKAAERKIIHKNAAARKKSRAAKAANKVGAGA